MALDVAIQGVVDEETFEKLWEDITVGDVVRHFSNAAYKILDDVNTLMSVPPSPRPLTFPLLLVSHTDSYFVLWNSQGAACSGL